MISPMEVIGFTAIIIFAILFFMVSSVTKKGARVVVKNATANGAIIENIYWTVEKKDKQNKAIWWQSAFWHKKFKLPAPPAEAVNIDSKGRKFVEVYRMDGSEDEFVYLRDKGINEQTTLKNGQKISEAFQAFTLVQRDIIVNQFRKAEAEKPKQTVAQVVMQIAPMAILAIVMIFLVIQWSEIQSVNIDVLDESKGLLQDLRRFGNDFTVGIAQTATEASSTGQAIVVEGEDPPTR